MNAAAARAPGDSSWRAAYPRRTVSRHRSVLLLLAGLVLLLAGCSSGTSAATVVRYERDWPDKYHEELTITDDGHVTMKHGDTLERLTLTLPRCSEIRDALATGVPSGDQGDSLVRTVVLANGTSVSPVKPVPGSSVELLELLMTTHSLNGAPVPGASALPRHAVRVLARAVRRIAPAPMLVIFGWAVVGLLIGHVAAYDLVYPDGHVHAAVLAASGHGWTWLLEPSLIIGLLVAIMAGFLGARGSHRRREVRFRVLAVIQVGAFLGIELLERLGNGLTAADIAHELTDHGLWLVLLIGIGAQLLTAWLGSAASRSVADAAEGPTLPRTALPSRPGHPGPRHPRPGAAAYGGSARQSCPTSFVVCRQLPVTGRPDLDGGSRRPTTRQGVNPRDRTRHAPADRRCRIHDRVAAGRRRPGIRPHLHRRE